MARESPRTSRNGSVAASQSKPDSSAAAGPSSAPVASSSRVENGQDDAIVVDDEEPNAADAEGEEEEEEYEIESIIEHDVGVYTANEVAYLVSWIGYPESENSWVKEEDAENAEEMLAEYWRKISPQRKIRKISKFADRVWSEVEAKKAAEKAANGGSTSRKRGRPSGLSEMAKGKDVRRGDESSDDDLDSTLLTQAEREEKLKSKARRRYERVPSWESIVRSIETVEKQPDGKLVAFVIFEDGGKLAFESTVVNHRCPQKVIAMYESRCRFRAPTRGDLQSAGLIAANEEASASISAAVARQESPKDAASQIRQDSETQQEQPQASHSSSELQPAGTAVETNGTLLDEAGSSQQPQSVQQEDVLGDASGMDLDVAATNPANLPVPSDADTVALPPEGSSGIAVE